MSWIADLAKELRIDPMGVKLNALREAKALGFDYASMTDEQRAIVAQRVRDVIVAIRKSAKK